MSKIMTANLDRADQEMLAYDVSDEVLEAAAGTAKGAMTAPSYLGRPEGGLTCCLH